MSSYLPLGSLFRKMRQIWKPWLALAVAAEMAVMIASLVTLPNQDALRAVVYYKYDGIEQGLNPLGGRFDADEIKNPQVLRAAAETLGLKTDDAWIDRVQDAISISGIMPGGMFERIMNFTGEFEGEKLDNTSSRRMASYYPTQYEILLRLGGTGLDAAAGAEYMNAVLSSYRAYFLEYYGYNAAFEQSLREFDYSAYDYEDAVYILNQSLDSLSAYLSWLSAQNRTRFVSSASGLSFNDIVSAIGALKGENLSSLSSYINTNYLTKDISELINYYQFMVEENERQIIRLQSRLDYLNQRIAAYAKDVALVVTGNTSGDGGGYEVTQPSEMYNTLINRKVDTQTRIASLSGDIDYYTRRIEFVQQAEAESGIVINSDKLPSLEEQFKLLDKQMNSLLDDTRVTAQEYFESVRLENAFQVLETPNQQPGFVRVMLRALRPGAGVMAVLFGSWILVSAGSAGNTGMASPQSQTEAPADGKKSKSAKR